MRKERMKTLMEVSEVVCIACVSITWCKVESDRNVGVPGIASSLIACEPRTSPTPFVAGKGKPVIVVDGSTKKGFKKWREDYGPPNLPQQEDDSPGVTGKSSCGRMW